MRSGRKSFGGNRLNLRSPSPSTAKRRSSFGYTPSAAGGTIYNDMDTSSTGATSTEPKKDRRTMLDEWRAQLAKDKDKENSNPDNATVTTAGMASSVDSVQSSHQFNLSSSSDNVNTTPPKRIRVEAAHHVPTASGSGLPLPPPVEGTTAVERFRMKRKQRLLQQSGEASDDAKPTSSNSICLDDDFPPSSSSSFVGRMSVGVGYSRLGSTPTRNRRGTTLLSGGARRRTPLVRGGRKSMSFTASNRPDMTIIDPPSVHTSSSTSHSLEHQLNSSLAGTTTISSSSDASMLGDINNADQPGILSRIGLMEKRIQELEKEKMALSMSKAPLEARLRQKEDQWLKEQSKYEQEIDELMSTAKEDAERFKVIENELEEIQQENRRLRLEVRKQTLGCEENNSGVSDKWSRKLQNDRELQECKDKLRSAEEEIKALRLEKVSVESEIKATNLELAVLMRDFDDMQREYEELQEQKDSNGEAEIQLEELTKEHTATLALLNATSGELASLRSQSKFEMENREREWQEEKDRILFEMSVLKTRAASNDADENMSTDSEDEAVLRARIEEKDRRIQQLENEVIAGEQIRREMHNTIQELRGNIRVFVRTRPFLPGDNETDSSPLDLHPDGENLAIETKTKKHDFKFDRVFAPSSGQDAVFGEVSEFVQSALDGYNVCLFSYGQTGSGKTHTMQGSGSGAMKGIIPRAVEQILKQSKVLQKQKWKFRINASFLEIYNEELKDLLVNMEGGVVTKLSGMPTRNQNPNKLVIRREKDGKSYVSGLKEIPIDTEDSDVGMQCLKNLMSAAARARSVASTKMNAVSSRSHSVFMLHLRGTNEETGAIVDGALNLCDLAGSERLDRSGAGSDAKRLKETQAINKSLSCLGDVFTALSNRSSHVPFRNSKLTYLLQDCLSGDGKALMFVNLSPTLESSGESLCSLRFAQRVNQVELGKATKHVSYSASS